MALEFKIPDAAVLAPEPDCPDCDDRGWVLRDDGGAGTMKRCECHSPGKNAGLMKERLGLAGLQEEEIRAAFSPWDETIQPKPTFAREWLFWALRGAEEACPASCYRPDGSIPLSPWSLSLLGEPGRGKTKTAAILCRLFIGAGGGSVVWARAPEAFDLVQAQRMETGGSEFENRLTQAELAVVDEVGVSHRSNAELQAFTIGEWIARRERRRSLTIATTNALRLADLEPRLASRLAEGVYRKMTGKDFRDR